MDSEQIILFHMEIGETKVEVRLANKSVWLTAGHMRSCLREAIKVFRVLSVMPMKVLNLDRKELWQ